MKIKRLLLFVSVFLTFPFYSQTSVMTYNIRYDNPDDGDNNWHQRKQEMVEMIKHYQPDVLGVQEGLHHQVDYLNQSLSNYQYYGVGREDALTKGEYAPIFYKVEKFDLLIKETFWLSETPNQVSVGWDAVLERIVTYVALWDKRQKQVYHVFNAHYDHRGIEAQIQSSQLILNLIKQKGLQSKQVIVVGDFNSLSDDKSIKVLKSNLQDAFEGVNKPSQSDLGTFNGFETDEKATERIDYIFTKNLNVESYQVINDKRTNGLQLSDHFPVFVKLFE